MSNLPGVSEGKNNLPGKSSVESECKKITEHRAVRKKNKKNRAGKGKADLSLTDRILGLIVMLEKLVDLIRVESSNKPNNVSDDLVTKHIFCVLEKLPNVLKVKQEEDGQLLDRLESELSSITTLCDQAIKEFEHLHLDDKEGDLCYVEGEWSVFRIYCPEMKVKQLVTALHKLYDLIPGLVSSETTLGNSREEIVMGDDAKLQNNNDFQEDESNDRISSLPDSLIQHILSFLPTKYVVPTEILSKRWKSLWIGVPSLDFEESRNAYSFGRFMNFVDKVLLLRDGSSIQQFRLSLSSRHSYRNSFVRSLIAVATSHKLQQLDITLCDKDQFTLPCSIFDCQSLSIVKLSMTCILELPSRISLPCLKVMHLCCFAFPNAKSIEKLFSCCPVLEELTFERCRWIHRNSISISIPSLKSLTMVDSFEKYDMVDDPNNSLCYIINVEAPSLQSFNYSGTLTNQLYLSKMSSIHNFQLSLSYDIPSIDSCLQSAIASAISHKLQMLDICLRVEDPFTLPCSIFDCQSLSILKLSMEKFTLELPDHISLPSLKVMHLHFFAFQNAKSMEKMFSCCPILEELALQDCKWINLDSCNISIPSLKILTIGDCSEEYDNSCSITVEASALLSFNYTGPLADHLNLTKMSSSSSIKAFIHITGHYFYRIERATRLVKLLQGLENMVSLTISNETAEVLSLADPVSDHLPVFHHLEYLDLSMKVDSSVFKWLLKFLNFMPNLGNIQFSKGVDDTVNKAGLRCMPKPLLPNCFSSTLKILGLGNFGGHYHEIFFLKSFLERAVSLQRVNICQNQYISRHGQQLFWEEMEKLPTRLKHCAIIVQ